ncbi:TetR/AcrR family transcriptional regulator [Streptomyces xanthochromogenes]|uniref:TetR/AcrR family transcriptional regulator n=1 Tax=Streptomyces xanthochromogenes TaxID=67384 RepID=UPI003419F474
MTGNQRDTTDDHEPGRANRAEPESGPRRRTGGRSARVREAVLKATAELIAEQGHERIPIAEIAERSGVHQTSIYRRWRTTNAIVLDLSQERLTSLWAVPDTGSLHGDLLAYAQRAAAAMAEPDGAVLLRALIAGAAEHAGAGDNAGVDAESVAAYVDAGNIPATHPLAERGRDLLDMLDRAASRGEPRLRLFDVLDGILAPIYLRTLFRIPGMDDAYLGSLVDKCLTHAAS